MSHHSIIDNPPDYLPSHIISMYHVVCSHGIASPRSLQAKGSLSPIVPDEGVSVSLQSGGIAVLASVGRSSGTSHYTSESGDFSAVYPAGSVECSGSKDDLLQMSAVSYRTSIGTEPPSPASLLRVCGKMCMCCLLYLVIVFSLLFC